MDLSPLGGMAVYLNPSLASNSMVSGAVDSGGADALVEAASGTLVVSAVNNALVGQWQATVSGHSIMGLGAACRPIYSGGFGRYPIYLFTHDGIMALPQRTSGIYGEPRLISQEVLASGAKPVMAGDVVWFVSRHGVLCSLSGSLVKRMLHGIEGDARSGAGNRALRVARAPLRRRPRKTQGGGAPARPLQPRNRAVALPVALHDAHAGRQARDLARREEAWFPDLLRRHNRNGRDGRAARRVCLCSQGNRARFHSCQRAPSN